MNNITSIKNILGMKADLESVLITPEKARKLMEFNVCNRKLSDFTVNKYAKQMSEGKWKSDASMITFSKSGELTNGQHILSAIIKSNVPIEFVVSMNIDNFAEMDRGKGRTAVDNVMLDERLRDKEVTKTKEIPSIVTVLYRAITGNATANVEAITNILDKYADDIIMLRDKGILFGSKSTNKRQVSGAMLVAYENGVNLELLKHIRDVLNTGICTKDTDKPIIALRDILLRTKGSGITVDKEVYRYSLYCIDACERGLVRKACKASEPKYTISWD